MVGRWTWFLCPLYAYYTTAVGYLSIYRPTYIARYMSLYRPIHVMSPYSMYVFRVGYLLRVPGLHTLGLPGWWELAVPLLCILPRFALGYLWLQVTNRGYSTKPGEAGLVEVNS